MGVEAVRVLVVDDDERFAASLIALLDTDSRVELAGWASNGAEAYAQVIGSRPDVITMDIDMPVLDGVEAIRLIAAHDPSIPIIVLSGSVSDQRVDEALAAGAVARIAKPRAADDLLDAIVAAHRGELTTCPPR
jgi:DNA-binding NarL/FixJ family response regulator